MAALDTRNLIVSQGIDLPFFHGPDLGGGQSIQLRDRHGGNLRGLELRYLGGREQLELCRTETGYQVVGNFSNITFAQTRYDIGFDGENSCGIGGRPIARGY